MAQVSISESLKKEIFAKFGGVSEIILKQMYSLQENPNKGKELGHVGNILIKEIRYEGFRFYFITDGQKLRVMDKSLLINLLIKFVRMSDKKSQQKTIEEIKRILKLFGEVGFD
jgi:hypothetical protein